MKVLKHEMEVCPRPDSEMGRAEPGVWLLLAQAAEGRQVWAREEEREDQESAAPERTCPG